MKQTFLVTIIFFSMIGVCKAQNPTKKWNYSFDLGFGYIPTDVGYRGSSSIALGVQHKSKLGLALALTDISDSQSGATGFGTELRGVAFRRLLLKAQIGSIVQAREIDDSGPIRSTYLPDKSQQLYFRGTVALQLFPCFYIGVSTVRTGDIVLQTEHPTLGIGSFTKQFKLTTWQIGLYLPREPSRKNKTKKTDY